MRSLGWTLGFRDRSAAFSMACWKGDSPDVPAASLDLSVRGLLDGLEHAAINAIDDSMVRSLEMRTMLMVPPDPLGQTGTG